MLVSNYKNAFRTPTTKHIARGGTLVVPGMAIEPQEAYRRYNAGTLQDHIENFYYDNVMFPGEEEIPDLSKYTRLERLELMGQKREQLEQFYKDNPGIRRDHLYQVNEDGTYADLGPIDNPNERR